MPAFVEPDILSEDIANKIHDFNSDTFRWVLSNTAPVLASTFLLSNVTQIATGGGYTQMTDGANGLATTVSFSRTGQTTTVNTTQVVLTATGAVATFGYIILINDTPTSPLNPVVGWVTLSSAVTMALNDTFTIPASSIFTIN
jgi:phage-related protein